MEKAKELEKLNQEYKNLVSERNKLFKEKAASPLDIMTKTQRYNEQIQRVLQKIAQLK